MSRSPKTWLLPTILFSLAACGSSGADATAKASGGAASNAGAAGRGDASGGASNGGSTKGGTGGAGASSNGAGASSNGAASSAGRDAENGAGAGSEGGNQGGGEEPARACKRGIAWPGKKLDNPEVNTKLGWWYRWDVSADGVGAGVELVPMIWGGGKQADDVSQAIRADAKYLLGYNEPNFFAQANLSAAQAAADWPTVEAVARAHGLKIVSPAVNYCGDVKNKTGPCHDNDPAHYLQDFLAACADCQVDYVAVHWYNCDVQSLTSYLDKFKPLGLPIWVTELACAIGDDTSVAGNEKYMREAVAYLEQRADVFRYSWFSADPIPNARLLNEDGSPTALGKIYLDLPYAASCSP
jgi:hypothetical protein